MTNRYSHEELIGLLPFYLSGKIDSQDKEAVISWLNDDPDAAYILEKVEAERQATISTNEAVIAPADGLRRLMKDVAETRQEVSLSHQGASLFSFLKDKLIAPLQAAPAELAWGVCGLLMLMTISQSALLYKGGSAVQGPGYDLASGEKHKILSRAVVQFSSDASMEKVAEFLDDAAVIIIDGPTASGHFVIGFTARDGTPELADRHVLLQKRTDVISLFVLKGAE